MKPGRKRKKGAGNSNPCKRVGFPDIDQEELNDAFDSHIRQVGAKQACNFFEYSYLEAQQAESPKAIFRLHGLINNLLQVSPTAQIKYKGIRDALAANMKKFGPELLSKHFENVEVAHLAGRAADSVLVLLKHWRRITSSPAAWERFGRKVEEAQLQVLMPLYKCTEKDPVKPRILKKEFSEVTVGSDGFPAMLATSGSESQSEASIPESLAHSLPPSTWWKSLSPIAKGQVQPRAPSLRQGQN